MLRERRIESADVLMMAFGAGCGVTWAMMALFVWSEWWSGPTASFAESLARVILLWPLYATFLLGSTWPKSIAWVHPLELIVGLGAVAGVVGGAMAAVWLHRSLD